MGQLFLSGGGNAKQTNTTNKHFVQKIRIEKPLLYIPIAGDPTFRPYEACLDYMKSVFNPLGIKEIIMWTRVKNKTVDELKQFSAVYISGGDPLKLLDNFKDSGFSKVLTQFFEDGGIIFGQSAGAIILGESIKHLYHDDPNKLVPARYNGLNLFKDYLIWCHYHEDDDPVIRNTKMNIVAVPEGTAIYTKVPGMKIIGTKQAYLFDSGEKKILHS